MYCEGADFLDLFREKRWDEAAPHPGPFPSHSPGYMQNPWTDHSTFDLTEVHIHETVSFLVLR